MPELLMPRLSDSMEEGTIVRWLVDDGAEVARGQEIVEIETDKATMEHEADADGPLRIVAQAGDTVAVGAPIAFVGAGEPTLAAGSAPAARPTGAAGSAPAATADLAPAAGRAPAAAASPVARRIAQRLGVDLSRVAGSGPGGRIVKTDVEAAAGAVSAPVPPAPAPPARSASPAGERGGKGAVESRELTRAQQTVARRMAETRATVPDFSVRMRVDVTEALELRARLKRLADPAPSLNDVVVAACARALREHPRVNGSFRDGRVELYERVNVGVAVAAGDALMVPTVFDADARSLGALASETRRLIGRVRDGGVTAAELAGGTFTISNLGMFGVSGFEAIVHGGQAAILAVGGVEKQQRWDGAAFAPRDVAELTLCCDHRILYGADAAAFLATVRELLEQPLRLALA